MRGEKTEGRGGEGMYEGEGSMINGGLGENGEGDMGRKGEKQFSRAFLMEPSVNSFVGQSRQYRRLLLHDEHHRRFVPGRVGPASQPR